MIDPAERFWSKVDKSGNCWLWTASLRKDGYGRFELNGKVVKANRAVWILTYGGIPDGLCVCHHCDNRKCVRPDHLFLGTRQDNMDDMVKKGRSCMGTKNAACRLTEQQVISIRSLAGDFTLDKIAEMFGISFQHVSRIINRNRWKYL